MQWPFFTNKFKDLNFVQFIWNKSLLVYWSIICLQICQFWISSWLQVYQYFGPFFLMQICHYSWFVYVHNIKKIACGTICCRLPVALIFFKIVMHPESGGKMSRTIYCTTWYFEVPRCDLFNQEITVLAPPCTEKQQKNSYFLKALPPLPPLCLIAVGTFFSSF